jgi:type I site-specific restriction endonuclease
LTATPKRKANIDTYKYFGEPVYVYSLKEGINDGFLTPFKVKRIKTSLDEYTYEEDDDVLEGDIDKKKTYIEDEFNKIIEIKAREAKRVQLFMDLINQNEKTLVFCAGQPHAAAVRDLINQYKTSKEPNYCVRVTANDGELGEQYLLQFQDNEKSIPTILTTSHKLSTGVDARNIRNIVLMRPIKNIVEFKQIIGRGTRLFDGKYFFTIYDFVNASERFKDPEWDGKDELATLQKLIDAENSDLFDVLEFIAYAEKPITREERVASAKKNIFSKLDYDQKEFLNFVLSKYIETGVEELAEEKLSPLLELKYHSISDAVDNLGGVNKIRELFIEFQNHLYEKKVA